ncbi:MAG: MBL fold metallo-hydrolase [Lawsonibacter sp.]
MKIKVLMENTTALPDFRTEHGLSLYLETGTHKLLFDTGQSDGFAENAERLGVNLADVDLAVLSHGHYDHGGGLNTFLSLNKKAPVYLSQFAFEPHLKATGKDIGLDPALQENPRLISVDDYIRLDNGLELFSCNEWERFYKLNPFGLTMCLDGEVLPEDFRHEQYLLITEGGTRILISGCSHKGILNLEEWFEPDVLIGGFHFMNLDPRADGRPALDAAAAELVRHDTIYYTCHCTGTEQYTYLKSKLKQQLHYLSAGQELEL